jgi:hypothetical protein
MSTYKLSDVTALNGNPVVQINNSDSVLGAVPGSMVQIGTEQIVFLDSVDIDNSQITLTAPWPYADAVNAECSIAPITAVSSLLNAITNIKALTDSIVGVGIGAAAFGVVRYNVSMLESLSPTEDGQRFYAISRNIAEYEKAPLGYEPNVGDITFANNAVGKLIIRGDSYIEYFDDIFVSPPQPGAIANALKLALDRQAQTGETIRFLQQAYNLTEWQTYTANHNVSLNSSGRSILVGPGLGTTSEPIDVDFIHHYGSLSVDNLSFEGFAATFEVPTDANSVIDNIEIKNCEFTDCKFAGKRALPWQVPGVNIKRIYIDNCEVSCPGVDSDIYTKGFVYEGRFSSVHCGGNTLTNLHGSALEFASDDYDIQDEIQNIHVFDNTISDLNSPQTDSDACNGIDVRGWKATIHDNTISNIDNNRGQDNEGIYTKIRFGSIHDNILINAGWEEASISIKGNRRGMSAAPQGFAITCHDNLVYSDLPSGSGIYLATDDIFCHDNVVEGCEAYAIYTAPIELNNLRIENNEGMELMCPQFVHLRHYGTGTRVYGNSVKSIKPGAALSSFSVVRVNTNEGDIYDVDIHRNTLNGRLLDSTQVTGLTSVVWFIPALGSNYINIDIADNEFVLGDANMSGCYVVRVAGSNSIAAGVTIGKNKADFLDNLRIEAEVERIESVPASSVSTADRVDLYVSDTGITVTNKNVAVERAMNLPVALPGLIFNFVNVSEEAGFPWDLRVRPAETQRIRGYSAGNYIAGPALNDSVTLKCIEAGVWDIVAQHGIWYEEGVLIPPDNTQPVISTSTTTNLSAFDSGKIITNEGVQVDRAANLPAAAPGLTFTFIVIENYQLRARPYTGDLIRGANSGEYLYSSSPGDTLTLQCAVSGIWDVSSKTGSWAASALV